MERTQNPGMPVHAPARFHHRQFADPAALLAMKGACRISVCIPTLDEAATIGPIVETIRRELMDGVPLVDELIVVDSDSTDGTRETAASAGARVLRSADIAPEHGSHTGKGENLWKALLATTGDIVCYIDGDISNFHSGFVTGLIGPLLRDERFDYVKAYYERPLFEGDDLHPSGGGRVSEILVRPLLSMFHPELTGILQPLSGEYAARRELLEQLAFPTGYGVEIAHLLDLAAMGKLGRIAQTDLEQRVHRNRDDASLGRMSFALLRVILRRLENAGKITLADPLPDLHRAWSFHGEDAREIVTHIPEPERPPLGVERLIVGN